MNKDKNVVGHRFSTAPVPQKTIRKNTKLYRVLNALVEGGTYNRFQAAQQLHDHTLHSTVSTIQNDYGIRVDRRDETVPGYGGAPTRVCRYWISPSQHVRAFAALGVTNEDN